MDENNVSPKKESTTDFLLDLLKNILISFVLILIIVNFIAIPVRVDGSSMYPNLKDGDFGFSGIFTKWFGIDRFDVVVIDSNKSDNRLVKRIIGLPNETIKYKDNVLYVNGEVVEETFLDDSVSTDNFEITLGDDEYFVLGDNREVSRDSRYYGPFTSSEIMAKGVLTLWPFSDVGLD